MEAHMWTRNLLLASAVLVTCSCVTMTETLAPGAERVRLTNEAAAVAGCKAVGNVSGLVGSEAYSETQLRNRTVGLDGNTVFVTLFTLYALPQEGVAYRCP